MSTLHRREVVRDLLDMRRPLGDVARDLASFPHNCARSDVQMLTRRQASRLLDLFTDEALTLDELEYWALLVAPRLDIEYEDDAEAIKEMVYVLANPQSNWRLDIDRAYDWIVALDVPGDSP